MTCRLTVAKIDLDTAREGASIPVRDAWVVIKYLFVGDRVLFWPRIWLALEYPGALKGFYGNMACLVAACGRGRLCFTSIRLSLLLEQPRG